MAGEETGNAMQSHGFDNPIPSGGFWQEVGNQAIGFGSDKTFNLEELRSSVFRRIRFSNPQVERRSELKSKRTAPLGNLNPAL
jgi:hypothetical protein